jgi:hypothetical protein
MNHVLWLGGRCGSGKTTISRALASRHDVRMYPVDAHGYEHRRRSGRPLPQGDFDERWLRPTPEELAERFVRESEPRVPLIRDDLAALRGGPLVIAEGPQLIPALVASQGHGVWLVPSEDFQRRMLVGRIEPSHTSDQERALRNRLARDAILNRLIRRQAPGLGLAVVDVDGSVGLDEMIEVVHDRFAERFASGPGAAGGAEHRRIRRTENAAVRDNLVAWREDAGVERMSEPRQYDFACECATAQGCAERILLTTDEFDEIVQRRDYVVAPAHRALSAGPGPVTWSGCG